MGKVDVSEPLMTSKDFLFDGVQYEVTFVSDVNREGQGMEVQDPRNLENSFALWFDDTTGKKTFIASCDDLPLELIARAIALFEEKVVYG